MRQPLVSGEFDIAAQLDVFVSPHRESASLRIIANPAADPQVKQTFETSDRFWQPGLDE